MYVFSGCPEPKIIENATQDKGFHQNFSVLFTEKCLA